MNCARLKIGGLRKSRRGFSLLEVAAATVVMVLVALGGASYYYYARLAQIRQIQAQSAVDLAEVEIERYREQGYGALAGYSTPTALPYGYNFSWASAQQTAYPYTTTVDGITYRISVSMLYNASTAGTPTNNYRWETTLGGVTYRFRRLIVKVEWGSNYANSISVEGDIGE